MSVGELMACVILTCLFPAAVHSHGRMLEPPSRMSAYLLGFSTPINYNDHEMNCGGRAIQWQQSGGKCGICGDPWPGPRNYERPNGAMVQHNIITKAYRENTVITITLQITANHLGWNEFRICDITKSGGVEATQECLDQTVLASPSGTSRFYFDTDETGFYNYTLLLPPGFTCSHCLLQWKWHCGSDWGCDERGCGKGFGVAQEEFYACADVVVAPNGVDIVTANPIPTTLTTSTVSTSTTRSSPLTTPSTTRMTLSRSTETPSQSTTTTSTMAPTTNVVHLINTTRAPLTSQVYVNFWNYLINKTGNAPLRTQISFPTNNINSREFQSMVLGEPNTYDPHYNWPIWYQQLPTMTSRLPEWKNANDRYCFVCYGNCRFEDCSVRCPSLCNSPVARTN